MVVGHNEEDYDGIEQLTRLTQLTSLGATGWVVSSSEGWSLVCSNSLRALQVCTISAEAVGPGVNQVTHLTMHYLSGNVPLAATEHLQGGGQVRPGRAYRLPHAPYHPHRVGGVWAL